MGCPRALREARRQRKNRGRLLERAGHRLVLLPAEHLLTASAGKDGLAFAFFFFSRPFSVQKKKKEFWGGEQIGQGGERAGKTGGHHERRREGAGLVGGPSEAEEESSGVAEPACLHVEEEAGGAPRAGAVPGGKQKKLAGRGNAREKWCQSVVGGKGQRGDADGSGGRGDRARRSKASEARQG